MTAPNDRDNSSDPSKGPAEGMAQSGGIKPRTLIAYQLYFGLEARVFHAGAQRMLERMCAHGLDQACINPRTLAEDFRLDAAASGTLLRAFMANGLLYPDGAGRYEATDRFREYALADIAIPLSRSQTIDLINRACGVAARINAEWQRSPFLIDTMAVSGNYMSGADLLPELPLWLVLRFRRQPPTRNPIRSQGKDEALNNIKIAIKSLSPIIVLHIVPDRDKVQRPFSVVFQEGVTPPAPALGRLRDGDARPNQWPVAAPSGTANSRPTGLGQQGGSVWIDVSKRG